jgi:hypothetical protein
MVEICAGAVGLSTLTDLDPYLNTVGRSDQGGRLMTAQWKCVAREFRIPHDRRANRYDSAPGSCTYAALANTSSASQTIKLQAGSNFT